MSVTDNKEVDPISKVKLYFQPILITILFSLLSSVLGYTLSVWHEDEVKRDDRINSELKEINERLVRIETYNELSSKRMDNLEADLSDFKDEVNQRFSQYDENINDFWKKYGGFLNKKNNK